MVAPLTGAAAACSRLPIMKHCYRGLESVMSIAVTHLTTDELVELNHQIIERLKMLETLETHKSMVQLHSGARVSFRSPAGERIVGTVIEVQPHDRDGGNRCRATPECLAAFIGSGQKRSVGEGRGYSTPKIEVPPTLSASQGMWGSWSAYVEKVSLPQPLDFRKSIESLAV